MSKVSSVDRDKEIPWSSIGNAVLFLVSLLSGERAYVSRYTDWASMLVCVVGALWLARNLYSKYRASKRE